MPEAPASSPARPAVALGLTFVIVGLTFALPLQLAPTGDVNFWSGAISPEVANVYACVAWAGWAHFAYAFRGQGNALAKIRDDLGNRRLAAHAAGVVCSLLLLLAFRSAIGVSTFGAIVWIYFIGHFIKAEQVFSGSHFAATSTWSRWISSYQPVLAFGWLSVVLLNFGGIDGHHWILLGVSLALAAAVLLLGGWRNLASGEQRGPLLALFFIGEGLVWGTFSHYGGPMFLAGVYVFHIAAGSYFHYLGSYFVANSRSGSRDRFLHPLAILGVNLAVVGLGFAVVHGSALKWLTPILGVQWFSLWVGLHLVSTDIFPFVKRWGTLGSGSKQPDLAQRGA